MWVGGRALPCKSQAAGEAALADDLIDGFSMVMLGWDHYPKGAMDVRSNVPDQSL